MCVVHTEGKLDFVKKKWEIKFLKISGLLRDLVNMADFNPSLKSMVPFPQTEF